MPIFQLAADTNYTPSENPVQKLKGSVDPATGVTTITIKSVPSYVIDSINDLLMEGRLITIQGPGIPIGGVVSSSATNEIELDYEYSVDVSKIENAEMIWYCSDVPNDHHEPITRIIMEKDSVIRFMDPDGTVCSLSNEGGVATQFNVNITRVITVTGIVLGFSKGRMY